MSAPAFFPTGSAASHATLDVPVLAVGESVIDVRTRLQSLRFESVRDLPVCDSEGLVVGVVRIEDLLPAEDRQTVDSIMDSDPPLIRGHEDEEVAASMAARDRESSLILVDDGGGFAGLVPPDRILAVMLQNHEEDVARLGGFLASAGPAERASRESVLKRLGHRLPWLLLGLAGALGAAMVVEGFEDRLRAHLLLAVFIPGVVYLADAVGTQTETLVIRGLSVGVPVRDVIGRELVTGVVAGVILGVLFLPVGMLIWGDAPVVVTVALALAAACSVANAVALVLPWLLGRMGIDPAFGSGPLATVIQDLLSIVIYLSIAVAVVD